MSLTMLAIVVVILLVTGIGQAIWRHSTQLGAYCRDTALDFNASFMFDACDALGQSIVSFQRYLEYQVGSSSYGGMMDLEQFAGHMARQFSSATLGYNAPELSGLINPSILQVNRNWQSASAIDRLSLSLTQGAQGNALLRQGNSASGLGYLQSSASMGELGLLSQLQLGSAYAQGGPGFAANPGLSQQYFSQALQSLNTLQRSNNPAAGRLLNSLPMPASQMSSQLQALTGGLR